MNDAVIDAPDHTGAGCRSGFRAWLASNLTADVRAATRAGDRSVVLAAQREWNASLFDAGYAAVAWPAEYGGRDADIDEQLVHIAEMAAVRAPGP